MQVAKLRWLASAALLVAAGCVDDAAWSDGAQRDAPVGTLLDAGSMRTGCRRESTHADSTVDVAHHDAAVSVADEPAPTAPSLLLTWNLEWFQHPSEGPSDDAAQYAAVRSVLDGAGASLIALQEIASETAFDRLLSDLDGYAGVLSGYDWIQRSALLWNDAQLELLSARALTGLDDAGRPPLRVTLRRRRDGVTWIVFVVHAKARADVESHAKRAQLARGLAAHLEALPAETPFIVLGDFNDALRGSILAGASTPYSPLVDAPQRYATPTAVLNAPDAPEASYAWGTTIDHIVLSADLGVHVVPDSVDVLRDELLARHPAFLDEVSDHFPVVLSLRP